MRKNVKETYSKWKDGATRILKHDSVSTDGTNIYSYNTVIAKWVVPGSIAILNGTRYSNTTSSQQNAIRNLLRRDDIVFEEMNESQFKNWRADEPG